MNPSPTCPIAPIETRYNGFRFRSRLEARWAILFDACDMAWQYEPEGFRTEAGLYLPDFYLPEVEVYIEIKGPWPNSSEIAKAKALAVEHPIALFHGLPGIDCDDLQGGSAWVFEPGTPDIEPGMGSVAVLRCGLATTSSGDHTRNLWADEVVVSRARSARFEHGERP